MWFPLIPLYISAITASSYGFWVQNAEPACPPKEELKPCKCIDSKGVTIECVNITDTSTLKNAFTKSASWKVKNVKFINCIIDYIPSEVLQISSLKLLNISSCSFVSLFDKNPNKTSKTEVFMYNTRIRRNMQWGLFRNVNIAEIGVFNVPIKYIGEDMKDHMPTGITYFWSENAKTSRIIDHAFDRMTNIKVFTIKGGLLRNCSRDWFPRPCNVQFMNLSNNKISALPKNLIEDMPKLVAFHCENNFLTTVDEDVFTKSPAVRFVLPGNPIYCDCDVKWIPNFIKNTPKSFWGDCDQPPSLHGVELYTLEPKQFNYCK